MIYKKTDLKNGLAVIEVPSSDAESVVVDIFVKTGSRSETPKENGISHFLEHFLFKGTKKYPSALAISEAIDAIGGEMNANTGKEHTQYYIKASSKYLELIFEILTEMVQNPLLDREEMEKEKGVIVEEINMYKDTPMYEIDNVLETTMWPKDTLGRDIAGTKETVTKFTREMFKNYIDRHYQTSNMILGVSGKYENRVLQDLVRKHWVSVPKKKFHGWSRVTDKQAKPRLAVKFKETEQAHLSFGFKGLEYGNKFSAAQSVLSAVLGGGMSSRLFIEVREKRGLAYYVRASGSPYQDTGVFNIGAGVQIGKIEEALQVILKELETIKQNKISASELKKAKEYLKGKTTLALEDNQVRLDWFMERCAFFPRLETPQEVFRRIDAVTAEEVQALAKKLFDRKIMSLAVIGPYKSEKGFRKIMSV
jgi:predicted Zn-dependent peptidase